MKKKYINYYFRHINTIKNIKLENEDIKFKLLEHEKLIDIFSYFFKKMQTYYNNENNSRNQSNNKFLKYKIYLRIFLK